MKTNINKEIFRRFSTKKKLQIIENLNKTELLYTSMESMKRIIKEVGIGRYKCRDKELRLSKERRTGNDWNSWFDGVELVKGKLYVKLTVMYANTDTEECESYATFFSSGEYRGTIKRCDMRGNDCCYYFNYSSDDKARAIKAVLMEYVYRKSLKLKNHESDRI